MAEGRETCAFIVEKRGRRCRMVASKGSLYCGEHLIHDKLAEGKRRIVCPLDPSHTVFEEHLQKHLKKCNVSKRKLPSCYSSRINNGVGVANESCDTPSSLSSCSPDQVAELIERVETAYRSHVIEIEESHHTHPCMDGDLSDPKNGVTALKHLQQQSSILALLESQGLLEPSITCYLEFGAGRGKLTECIHRARVSSLPASVKPVQYVLVDKASCRRKVDGLHRASRLTHATCHRLLMDIADLDLSKVAAVEGCDVVAVSKHLCGAATDLTLRCLCEGSKVKMELRGIAIALCCHHRCSWQQLVGQDFLMQLGFGAADFHLLSHMTSWAVCGRRPPKHDEQDTGGDNKDVGGHGNDAGGHGSDSGSYGNGAGSHGNDAGGQGSNTGSHGNDAGGDKKVGGADGGRKRKWGYVPHHNEEIGLKCKRLIDLCRLHYLQQQGMLAKLVYYVDRGTSLENVLLLAVPKF